MPMTGAQHAANLEAFFASQNVEPGQLPALPPQKTSTGAHLNQAAPGKGRLSSEVAAVLRRNGYGDRVVTDSETGKLHFARGRTSLKLSGAQHAARLEEFFASQNVEPEQLPALPLQQTPTGEHLHGARLGRNRLPSEVADVLRRHGYGDRVVRDPTTGKLHFAGRFKRRAAVKDAHESMAASAAAAPVSSGYDQQSSGMQLPSLSAALGEYNPPFVHRQPGNGGQFGVPAAPSAWPGASALQQPLLAPGEVSQMPPPPVSMAAAARLGQRGRQSQGESSSPPPRPQGEPQGKAMKR